MFRGEDASGIGNLKQGFPSEHQLFMKAPRPAGERVETWGRNPSSKTVDFLLSIQLEAFLSAFLIRGPGKLFISSKHTINYSLENLGW